MDLIENFNNDYPIHTEVYYHPWINEQGDLSEHEKVKTYTTSEAYVANDGHPVIFVNARAGYVSLLHIVLRK